MTRSINLEKVKSALVELADRRYQEIVWVGEAEGLIGSIDEALATLFDDSGLEEALNGDEEVFGPETDSDLRDLGNRLVRLAREQMTPEETLTDPRFLDVRAKAATVLFRILRWEASELEPTTQGGLTDR